MKICNGCSITLTKENIYPINFAKRIYLCNSCFNKRQKKYYQRNKEIRLVKIRKKNKDSYLKNSDIMKELKINGCAICGYNAYTKALDFHHVNPEDKQFNINIRDLSRRDELIVDELNKCILLCKNCHAEIEGRNYE